MTRRPLSFLLLIGAICIARSTCNYAQDAGKTSEAPANSTSDSGKQEVAPQEESRIANPIGSVVPDQPPLWARETNLGREFDEVPATTDIHGSAIEVDGDVDRAIRRAIEEYICECAKNLHAARRIVLTREDLGAPNIERIKDKDAVWHPHGDTNLVQKAVLIKVPHATRDAWLNRFAKVHRQESAITQTLFVGGGILAALAIFTLQAKVNHATNGRRGGILRAVTSIAILSLLGGLTTAAIMGRIFSV